ncbi:conserved hypothetical protein [Xenorhabdus nematophila F1]|uniref:Uncharacterized protein n=1 Tax=Xenorhabdus nematophila (strain ATCC 19061 / DSM 3370 / CCUG 14189 / LMG 1036 / NCIMB 9965 / AN6) TaxID=406817 RepID=D3VFK6_XENNA|nr:hypothetical protein XNC1_2261 [Xenorhabdus nematophila ATCC 19061]CCW32330.1 conserved hypothetical protein [Xenorhabdus nematophila F1]CEE89917.1 hypothetical protein XNA1_1000007 [Xenorhabdus nematophila str. Anatoliense]CEF30317.1 hypothetical protein XNW1_2410026 [Xenorhabdus nematophila str. Websteri]CEK23177.1 hypothetical protein XNC2_2183 [Xenorhabdus nematophila AN6/1]
MMMMFDGGYYYRYAACQASTCSDSLRLLCYHDDVPVFSIPLAQ